MANFDAINDGKQTAVENLKDEERPEGDSPQAAIDAGQEAATKNHKADYKNSKEARQATLPANDTSKKAKDETTKSQLEPGFDTLGEPSK